MSDSHNKPESGFTYSKAGVDISHTDNLKDAMSQFVGVGSDRVLNGLGPFASLFDFKFDGIEHPVLVLKSEEPGSKQKLATQYGYVESVCHDMINHLVNDIIVMGATPLAVLDTIVCGTAEQDTVKSIIKGVSEACLDNECTLVGGETSVQPGIVDNGTYILTSSIAGVVDKSKIIDGSAIAAGDVVLAVASNGLHTNGYSLVRMLMNNMPEILDDTIDGESFIDAIMKPHTPYYRATKDLTAAGKIKGMAHITGSGIEGNLERVIPDGLCAKIDLSKIKTLPLFSYIKSKGNVSDGEMLRTFNCGVGLNIVADPAIAGAVAESVGRFYDCYEIGKIIAGNDKIVFENNILW